MFTFWNKKIFAKTILFNEGKVILKIRDDLYLKVILHYSNHILNI